MYPKDDSTFIVMLVTLIALVELVLSMTPQFPAHVSARTTVSQYAFQEREGIQIFDNSLKHSIYKSEDKSKVLVKRDKYDAAWYTNLQEAGRCMIKKLTAGSIADSAFKEYSDIKDGGWDGGPTDINQDTDHALGPVIANLGGAWADYQQFQHKLKPLEGVKWKDGEVQYRVLVDPYHGFIVVPSADGPPKDTPDDPPGVKRLSDYTFLVYKQACADAKPKQDLHECFGRLKWVVHLTVSNLRSIEAGRWAVGQHGENPPYKYPQIPGTTYQMSDPKGQAILASPNGVGVAYLCAQHKGTEMGKKIPDYVMAFSDVVGNLGLAFHLSNYNKGMDAWGGGDT